MTDLGIGIIGAGNMARTFAECLAKYTRGGRLRAVAGRTRAPAAPTAMVHVQFANGVLGIFRGCIELPPPGFREPLQCIQVVGSNGRLQINPYGKVDAAIGGTWETVWEQPPSTSP